MRRVSLTAILLLAFCIEMPLAAEPIRWLPLKKADVVELLAGEAIEAVKVETLDGVLANPRYHSKISSGRRRDLKAQQTELTNLFAPDDAISVVSNEALELHVSIAGRDEHIHSLRVTVAFGRYWPSQEERLFAILSAIFRKIYPTWIEAQDWPKSSLRDAWNMHHFNDKRPLLEDANDVIIKRSLGGITSATFGVPPDLVVYAITARSQCIPFVDRGNPLEQHNPLARIIC